MVTVRAYTRENKGNSGPKTRRANKSLPRNITKYKLRGKTYLQLQICRHGESLKLSEPLSPKALPKLLKSRRKFLNCFKDKIVLTRINGFKRKPKPKKITN